MSNLQLFTNLIAIVELNEEEQDPLCMFLFDDIKSQQGQDPEAIQLVEEIKEHKRVSLSTIEPTCYTKDSDVPTDLLISSVFSCDYVNFHIWDNCYERHKGSQTV